MPFTQPFRRPDRWQSWIVIGPDGFYCGANDVGGQGEHADCALVHDDLGEAWGTVAWMHDKPSEWWIGRYPFYPEKGQPPIMGAPEVVFASDLGCELVLVETPARYVELAWSGRWPGPTACVLDWERPEALRVWLSLVMAIRCETDTLARAVESMLGAIQARQRLRIELGAAQ